MSYLNSKFRRFTDKEEFMRFVSRSRDQILKEKLICELCKDKNVLDIGCIDHSYKTALDLGSGWLHKRLKDVSKSIVGIDILREDIKKLNDAGFNIVEADAESFDLNRTFDVIVAGDLIEHLSNVGLFLSQVVKHMHSDSICIITTPNPFNIEQTMLAIFENYIGVNDEHTAWLDPRVMYELLSRTELEIIDFYWIKTRFKIPFRIFHRLSSRVFSAIIMNIRPICRQDYAVILKKASNRPSSH